MIAVAPAKLFQLIRVLLLIFIFMFILILILVLISIAALPSTPRSLPIIPRSCA